MQKSTFIVASLLFAVAGYAGIACSASARSRGFDDPDDGAGGKGSGNGVGGLDFTSGNTGTGGGVLGTEPACDGVDPTIDNDADGWTGSNGDCNDCTALMNPGALDFPGNNIDEDCNAAKDDNPGSCDGALPLNASNAVDAARAMGLCKLQDGDAQRWGLISAEYITPDGQPFFQDPRGYGILSKFGQLVNPQEGSQMFVLSSGSARNPNDPDYCSPQFCDKFYSTGSPAGYPKEAPACPNVDTGTPFDGVGLRIRVKTPTNAKSLRFALNFYTYEFPDYICSEYNDYYVSMLTPVPAGQPDGNISFDTQGNTISVNAGFLEVCTPQMAGGKNFPCSLGPGALAGTGFDEGFFPGNSAATSWLQTTSPLAKPGEEIQLEFSIWDSGDGVLDSTVLLDKFEFIVDAAPTQTTPVPEPK